MSMESVHTRTLATGNGEPIEWLNASGLPDSEVAGSLREVAFKISNWMSNARSVANRTSLFDRAAYTAPDNPYAQMRIGRHALDSDDVVAGTCDVTEGLMFQGVKWESTEPDEADVFNQNARDLNLDDFLRIAHRELFACSQVVVASWWDRREYKVRGRGAPEMPPMEKSTDPVTGQVRWEEPRDPKTGRPLRPKPGVRRKKSFNIHVPTRLAVLDSTKVVPVGKFLWGEERLAWNATAAEMAAFDDGENGPASQDVVMATLFLGRYVPASKEEEDELADLGVDPKRLLEFNPRFVWRHCLTKPTYARFPDVRLKSVFRLLDLKMQLMEADRVNLIGAANYILLVKKGSKEEPAYPEEITNLRENFDVVARLPVIFSDHRLEIEIISPKTDLTLQGDKYDTLDKRILSRLLGSLTLASSGQRNESTLTLARMVARVLENRRHMLKRALEDHIAHAVVEHPGNDGQFTEEPNLAFTPRQIQLDNEGQMIQAIMAARTQKELSRESYLEFIGFDQEVEAQRRVAEEDYFDPIFQTTIPFSSPALNAGALPPPQLSGATGGRPGGGGEPAAGAAPRPKNPTPGSKP